MFHAYFDDSKDAADTIVTVAAGWVADGRAWDGFNEAWETVLYRKQLSEFKAADCEGGFREYKGRTDRDELRHTLIALVAQYGLSGVACAVNTTECDHAIDRARREFASAQVQWSSGQKIPVGYLLCMRYCLVEAYRMTPEGEKLYVVFDQQAGAIGRVPHLVRRLKRDPSFEAADRISDNEPRSKDSLELPGLQAADLLAYETMRHAEAQIRGQSGDRIWHELLAPLTLHARYVGGDEIALLLAELLPVDFDELL
jgi:hypothetical protein